MIKLELTSHISSYIKKKREEYNLKSSTLADKLGKSNAYISKLEKGDFKTIDLNDLYDIIGKIIGDEVLGKEDVDKFLCTYISKIITVDQYFNDVGIQSYDETILNYDINTDILKFILDFINKQSITSEDITNFLNTNEDLSEEEKTCDFFNEYGYDTTKNEVFIKFHAEKSTIDDILFGKKQTCRYIDLLMIIYAMLRLSKKPTFNPNAASRFSKKILTTYNFVSNFDKRNIQSVDLRFKEELAKVDNLPLDVKFSIAKIINFMDFVTDKDIIYSINKSVHLKANLDEEPSFLMALLETDITPIKDISFVKKRELLDDIHDLIKKYSEQNDEIDLL